MKNPKIALPIIDMQHDFIPNGNIVCSGVDFITSLTKVIQESPNMKIRVGEHWYNLQH